MGSHCLCCITGSVHVCALLSGTSSVFLFACFCVVFCFSTALVLTPQSPVGGHLPLPLIVLSSTVYHTDLHLSFTHSGLKGRELSLGWTWEWGGWLWGTWSPTAMDFLTFTPDKLSSSYCCQLAMGVAIISWLQLAGRHLSLATLSLTLFVYVIFLFSVF